MSESPKRLTKYDVICRVAASIGLLLKQNACYSDEYTRQLNIDFSGRS